MNIEQIIIRLGVDATAVKTGLGKVSASFKTWGVSIAHGMKEYFGSITKGFLGAEAITKTVEYFGELKNKILEIARIERETGANTNFVQGLQLDAAKAGRAFEGMDMSLIRFNKALGAAKEGSVDAIKKLYDIGIIGDKSEIKTLNFTKAMNKLAEAFDKTNDKAKQSALLGEAFGKGSASMSKVFEQGAEHVRGLSNGNFFTKISEGAITDFETAFSAIKISAQGAMATVINIIDFPFARVREGAQRLGLIFNGVLPFTKRWKQDTESLAKTEEEINNEKTLGIMAEKDGISVQEEKTRILEKQKSLLEKQAELTADIADRDKESVAEMAANARKLTGVKGPLEMMHTVTPRMRTALRIDTLEQSAKVATLRGNDAESNRLQTEADAIRKANPWLKRSDVNPMAKTETELGNIKEALEPVTRAAKLVTNDK